MRCIIIFVWWEHFLPECMIFNKIHNLFTFYHGQFLQECGRLIPISIQSPVIQRLLSLVSHKEKHNLAGKRNLHWQLRINDIEFMDQFRHLRLSRIFRIICIYCSLWWNFEKRWFYYGRQLCVHWCFAIIIVSINTALVLLCYYQYHYHQ